MLFALALMFTPLFWACFNIIGIRIGLGEMYRECIAHYRSGEPWGAFDG